MEAKDKKDKDKKDKDKKDKDKKEKKSKEKSDASPTTDEKKDKKEKKSKEKGDTSATTDEKKDKKEKQSKEKKEADEAAASSSKDVQVVGSTTYRRHVTKDADGKKLKLWVVDGHGLDEKKYVWFEVQKEGSSEKWYRNDAESGPVWKLPDLGESSASPKAAGAADRPMVFIEERRDFKERKEYKEKSAKKSVNAAVGKALMSIPNLNTELTPDEIAILKGNIAAEYMSLFKKLDAEGDKWITETVAAQIAEISEKKKAYAATQLRQAKSDSISGKIVSEQDLPLPSAPLPAHQRTMPSSPLLPRAWYLKDPYYYRRVNSRNPRRAEESKLEDMVFMQPGAGTIKVLCTVLAKVTSQEKPCFAAVVRDWAGAFCLMFLVQTDVGLFVVDAAYPLLEYVDFEKTTETKGTLLLDDLPFIMAFASSADLNYFVDSIRLAMCAMYGQGGDDTRTITMRAYSLEFSSVDPSYFPNGAAPDTRTLMPKILGEDSKEGAEMNGLFADLCLCMRTPEGRDACLRAWVRSMNENPAIKAKRPAAVSNHVRVIEEANRHPAYNVDLSLPSSVVAHLATLRADQPEAVRQRIEAARTTFRIMTTVMDQWRSRVEIPDKAFELMFEPADGTVAAKQDRLQLLQRRNAYARNNLLPGIYVTLLCYSGGAVLCHPDGNLFSEVIVPSPTEAELDALTPDNADFRWILSIGGAGAAEDWAMSEVTSWCDIYENAGRSTFRAKFLHAARRLFQDLHVPSLGVVFDVPVIHRHVSTAHIMCVLKVASRDVIPVAIGEWRNTLDFEAQLYLQTCTAPHSARIEHLPARYNNCVRSVAAAIEYRESIDKELPPGLHLGFLVFTLTSGGPMVLVPESSRNMVSLSLVSDEMPTLEQWRWVQGLNERKRRTRSFGLVAEDEEETSAVLSVHLTSHHTFEQRFAKAVAEVEAAVGLHVDKFYDYDLFVLDEERQRRAVFGVYFLPTAMTETARNYLTPAVPQGGQVPMVWKHVSVLDDAYFRLHWPRTFNALFDERAAHLRRAYKTCQPFSTDEVARLQHESSLAALCDVDKYGMLVSWCRPIVSWLTTDSRTLVEQYGGTEDASVARSIDELVEIAVSNYASTQDINAQTMKALLLESATSPHFSWPTLLSKLREIDRVVALGYAQRVVDDVDRRQLLRKLRVRTHDERSSDPDSDTEAMCAPTDYTLPCTLEELVLKDTSTDRLEKYFETQEVLKDIVEEAVVQCVEVGEVKEIGKIIADMITVIEWTDDLVDAASIDVQRQDAVESSLKERETFQKHWLDVFKGDVDLQNMAEKRPGDDGNDSPTRVLLQHELDEDFDNPLNAPLYADGSSRAIRTFDEGVRVCFARAQNTSHTLETMLRVCTSTLSALEVVQSIQEYSSYLSKRETLVRRSAQPGKPPTPEPASAVRHDPDTPAVTIVSKEFAEHPVSVVDPLRCLVLHNVTGKVRFPTVASAALEVLAEHLNQSDFTVPQSLAMLRPDKPTAERLLEMSLQMKAPLLTLRLVSLIFGTTQGPSSFFFTGSAAVQLRTLLQDGFMFEYGIKDWLHMEVLGGDPVVAAMDVLWWIRFLKEAVADGGDRPDSFSDHEGSWKQVYAETRIRILLSFGVHALTKEEVALWAHSLGRYVEYLSLKDSHVGDAEIEILCQCCPNLRSLDLSYSSCTSRGVEALVQHCSSLVECSVEGCDVPASVQDALRRHCADNRTRIGSA